jgi:hypothetical protein
MKIPNQNPHTLEMSYGLDEARIFDRETKTLLVTHFYFVFQSHFISISLFFPFLEIAFVVFGAVARRHRVGQQAIDVASARSQSPVARTHQEIRCTRSTSTAHW